MLSPMMTVFVLAVLWLIVVIPMFIKRKDERAGERAMAGFSSAMRALSARRSLASVARPVGIADEIPDKPRSSSRFTRPQLFVPGRRGATSTAMTAGPVLTLASRSPQPVGAEAGLYPDRVAKADLSQARRRMMTRRRRSLGVLAGGLLLGAAWSLHSGSVATWLVAGVFGVGLAGYLFFLRSQALRDRDRRDSRVRRVTGLSTARGYEATAGRTASAMPVTAEPIATAAVAIDDDDPAVLGIAETVDLTGLYVEDEFDQQTVRRAV